MPAPDNPKGDLKSEPMFDKFTPFPRLKVSTRLIAGFSIIAGISIAVGIIGLYFIHQIDGHLNRITDITAPTVEVADDLIANVWQATKVAEESILANTAGELAMLIEEFQGLGRNFNQYHLELKSLLNDQKLLAELQTAKHQHTEFQKHARGMFESRQTELLEQMQNEVHLLKFNRLGVKLIVSLTEFAEENEAELFEAGSQSRADSSAETTSQRDALGQAVNKDYPVVEAALKLQQLMTAIKDTARSFLSARTRYELSSAMLEFHELERGITPQIDVLQQFAETEEDRMDVANLKAVLRDWMEIAKGVNGLYQTHENMLQASADTSMHAELLELGAENTAAALNRVADYADAINDGADEETAAVVDQARTVIALLLLLAIIVSIFLVFIVMNTVARPIKALAQAMVGLGEGNINSTIDLGRRSDEIGELASTFNEMAMKLDKATRNLEAQVLARTTDLNATNKQLEEELTRRHSLEGQLVRAQKLDSLGTLAGGVAHDFNNMLYVIIGCAEMALKKISKRNVAFSSLVRIEQAARRSATIVRQILLFSRHEKPDRQPLEVSKTIHDSVMLLRAGLPSSLLLDVDIQKSCGYIHADETQIHQVIVNFVTNAFHAYDMGTGTVSLSAVPFEADEKFCRQNVGLAPGKYVRIRISDEGAGIAPEHLPRIFDPFFTTKPVGQGTGLGLSVAHGIVTNHGGVIALTSTPEKGTTANIYLPANVSGHSVAFSKKNGSAGVQKSPN